MLTCATLTFLVFQLFLLLVKNPLHYSQVNVIQVYLAQLQFIYSFIYLFNCVCVCVCVCKSFLTILCQFRQPAQNSCANCGLQRPFKSCENKVNVVVVVVVVWPPCSRGKLHHLVHVHMQAHDTGRLEGCQIRAPLFRENILITRPCQ